MAESAALAQGGIEVQNRFGKLAIKLGYCTREQLNEAMKVQAAAAKAGFRKRLGDILVKKGYLTPEQLKRILSSQKVEDSKKRIASYEIISKLGEGSMGSVFKARQMGMDRLIALKLLSPDLAKDEDFRQRFIKEARAVAKLNHPYIVSGIDVGEYNKVYYFAMEYVDGQTLAQRMESCGGRLPEKEALDAARQTAMALEHAHQHGLLHRDVKPENILIDKTGAAKLADLGLVRMNLPGEDFSAEKGLAIGTPFYISPEQAQGLLDITPAADIYSLGATLYHVLTGEPPYDADTGRQIMKKHVREPVPDPRDVNPVLSPRTTRICMKCMKKEPKERYRDCGALARDLERAIVELAAPPKVNPTTRSVATAKSKTPAGAKSPAKPKTVAGAKSPTKPRTMPTPLPGARTNQPRRRMTSRRGSTNPNGILLAAVIVVVVILVLLISARRRPPTRPTPPPPPPRNNVVRQPTAPAKSTSKPRSKTTKPAKKDTTPAVKPTPAEKGSTPAQKDPPPEELPPGTRKPMELP